MFRIVSLFLLLGALLLAGALFHQTGWTWLPGHTRADAPFDRPNHAEQSPTTGAQPVEEGSEPKGSADVASADGDRSSVDVSATSWQDPFRETYWTSTGWEFDKASMHSTPQQAAKATFCRTYRKLMLDVALQPSDDGSLFEVHLAAPATKTVAIVVIGNGRVAVATTGSDRERHDVRSKEFDLTMDAERPGNLRLAATGTRILVVWNGRRVFACDQPAEQSGRDLSLTLVSPRGGYRISNLRIEGE
jgi:hypothetical protein